MNKENKELHITIIGRVQGVGFRAYGFRIAKELGLNGYVRNTEEGNVEIVVQADPGKVAELISRIRKGPGRVLNVIIDEKEAIERYTEFNIKY